MATYTHLLLAADFSEEQQHVSEQAAALARQLGAKLSLLHVVDRRDETAGPEVGPPIPSGPGDSAISATQNVIDPAPVIAGTDQRLLEEARRILDALAGRLGVPDSDKIVVGSSSVGRTIAETARRIGADLVVVGMSDRYWLSLVLGSNSERVLRAAACDVLAVRAREDSVARVSVASVRGG